MTPRWQRARIVNNDAHPEEIGRLLWVRERWNACTDTRDLDSGFERIEPVDLFKTNLITKNGEPVGYEVCFVELLARSPEDFADDVPLASWEGWLSGIVT